MSDHLRRPTLGLAIAVTAALLSIGCGGARPKLPAGLDLDQLIAAENLAFFLEPKPEGIALAVELDRTGERMLTAHEDGQVLLWDAASGRAIAELAVHDGGAATAAFSPDGKAIATAGARDGRVSIWSATTGTLLASCETAATDIAWSPDSARIAVGSRTGIAALCDAKTGEVSGSLAHAAPAEDDGESSSAGATAVEITAIAWSADGEHVVTAGTAGVVSFWNVASLKEVHSDLGHTGPVLDLVAGPEPGQIASAGDDGTVQIIESDRSEPVATFFNESVPVRCAALSADGGRLAWGADDGRIKIWDAVSGEQLLAIEAHLGAVTSLTWSPDGGRLVSAGVDGNVRVTDTENGDELLVITTPVQEQMPGRAAWSPDGGRLATSGGGAAVEIWYPRAERAGVRLVGPHHAPISLAWSPDGSRLASGGRDESVRLWNTEIDAFAGEIRGLDGPVLDLRWSSTHDRLAAVGWGGVHVLTANDGRVVFTSLDHQGAVNRSAFSPDGETLATAGADGEVKLWSASAGKQLRAFKTGATPATALGWSAEGSRLAVGADDGVVWIWNAETGVVEHTLEHPQLGPVFGVDWGPDDARVAVVDGYGGLYVWNGGDGATLELIARGPGASWSVDWRPDGEHLLVGASNGAWIHRLSDGARLTLGTFEKDGEDVWLAFTDTGLFCGDEAAFGRLSFRVKDDLRAEALLPVEAMVRAFYREDLLTEFLGGEVLEPPGR